MSNPILIPQPFAANGNKNTIQNTRQTGQDPEDATWSDGFPPVTMQPMESGGLPPKGMDFNGLLNAISAGVVYAQKGGRYLFDASYATSIGGYPKGAILQDNAGVYEYISLVDGNATDFNVDPGSNWSKYADVDGLKSSLGTAAYANIGTDPGQVPDMTSFYASISGASGYQMLPSGSLIQWGGSVSTSGGSVLITYPIAFTTLRCAVVSGAAFSVPGCCAVGADTSSLTQLRVWARNANAATGASIGVNWIAVGSWK